MRRHLGVMVMAMLVLCCTLAGPPRAAPASATVQDVLIEGNRRIEDAAILRVIETQAGDAYDPDQLSRDLEAIFEMGYFDDIRVKTRSGKDGKVVIFQVEEKPTIRRIEFSGNMVYEDAELEKNIDISTGSILNIFRVKRNMKQIGTLYKEKNYHNTTVSYDIEELEHNQAVLKFQIDEGEKLRISEIRFEGNKSYEADRLKDKMKTSERWFLSWLTSAGDLDTETLQQDVIRLTNFYQNNGYAEARVGEPEIMYQEDGILVEIKIEEGERFEMGDAGFAGDLIFPEQKLQEKLSSAGKTYFSRKAVRSDVVTLSDAYADEGYAHADISPRIKKNPEQGTIDVVFHITKNKPVYFERIVIEGNTKTRDKVIRRELEVYEGQRYNGSKLKKSVRDLYRLDYFKDVKVRREQGSSEDQMVLNIEVEEKPTGSFSVGGGYSAIDDLYMMASITERNLFGRGQYLDLRVQAGGNSQQYDITFREPWLFDIPLSATVQANKWERDYEDYIRDSTGASFRLGYEILDYTNVYFRYAFDVSEITDWEEYYEDEDYYGEYDYSEYYENYSSDYWNVWDEDEFVESSVSTGITYDSRNRKFNPTEGSKHRLTLEYAGLGGNVGFTKITAETGWYFPVIWDTTFFLHAEGGYVDESGGKILPDYERFYLGGINSLRGFDWRDVSPENEEGYDIGGDRFIQFNVEYLVPLLKDQGLVGLVFYDTGNAFDGGPIEFDNLRKTWGYGIRWYSPMGPLRLERGMVIDPRDDEEDARWEFSIGGSF
ncbi:MAG TPA: outer membrane protein assembly factor BamA [Desulfosalsimonadaceae bacterium]|nr:outer membrane protein assembly factor BamA [Desulfosalsimonadaceae bacterium]